MNTADTFALGLRCHQAGDFSQAEQLYRQILDSDPHHCDALHLLGLLELATGRSESGIGHIRQVLRLDPSCIQAHFNLGSALRGQGQLDEAIVSYRQALALQPNNARSHLNLGHALTQFLCAALTGTGRPAAAPREYVADLFDRDTAAFEAHLVTRLGYRGPQVLREAVADPAGA